MAPAAGRPGDRVHQHRKEGHHHDHRGLRLPVEAEPHHHDRRDADDRQRRDEIAERQQPAVQEGDAVDERSPTTKPGAAADRQSRRAPPDEGLHEVRRQRRDSGGEAHARSALGGGSSTCGTPNADVDDLPQATAAEGAEQQRHARRTHRRAAGHRWPGESASPWRQTQRRDEPEHPRPPEGRHTGLHRRRRARRTPTRQRERQRDAAAITAGGPRMLASAALREPDDADRRHRPGTARHEQRRPDLDGLAVIGAGQQPRAQPGLRAGRQFADDGADQARSRSRPSGWEQEGHAAGQRSLRRSARGGAVGAHQIELHRVGRAQALHHADGDRERSRDSAEMIAFGSKPGDAETPSTTMMIGAMARIGIVCEAMIHGIRLRSSARRGRSAARAAMPSSEPSTKPSSVADSVTQAW